ncbi:MAG: magnesium transporter CorA family protein [Candidatus Aenigmatarchaeota archaeon]
MMKFLYKNSGGKVTTGSKLKGSENGKSLLWLHVTNPGKEEIKSLKSEFNLSDKLFEKFFKEKKSIRYNFKPLSFVLVDYYAQDSKLMVEDVLYIVGKNYLITITNKKLAHYEKAFDFIKEKMKKIKNVGYLLYEILDFDVEENYEVLSLTEKRVTEIEKDVLNLNDVARKITNIIEFKRYLLTMWRRFWSSSKILFSVKKGMTPIEVDNNLIMLLDDVHNSYVHQMDIVSSQREIMTDALTIYESVLANRLATISNNINVSVKRLTLVMFILTGIGTVLTVPNTVATIFGIPEWPIAGDQWKFIALLLVVSAIIPSIWFYFYWKKIVKKENEDR